MQALTALTEHTTPVLPTRPTPELILTRQATMAPLAFMTHLWAVATTTTPLAAAKEHTQVAPPPEQTALTTPTC